MLLFTLDIISR